jgi:hypothetical protein
VAVQPQQWLIGLLGVSHRGAPNGRHLHLTKRGLHRERRVEERGLVELCAVWRRVQVEDGALGMFQLGHHRVDRGAQVRLVLLAIRVPRRHVRVAAADHLVLVIEPDDLALAVRPPRGSVEQGTELLWVVIAQHEVERDAERPEPRIRKLEPLGEPLAHHLEKEVVETAGRLLGFELPRIRAHRVIPVIGNQLLQGGQLGPFDDVVVGADEPALPVTARCPHDRLDRLAGDVAAEDHHLRFVDFRCVDELAEAHAGPVQVADEIDPCFGHVRREQWRREHAALRS